MPESDRTSTASRRVADGRASYWERSQRPLESLAFLLPLIVAYEIGSIFYLSDAEGQRLGAIKAEKLLGSVFELFGVVGLALPPLLLVTVLLVWHMLEGRSSKLRLGVLAGMAVESAAWTVPLVVLVSVVSLAGGGAGGLVQGEPAIGSMAWPARLTISLGAGLYEELLFRMVGIALVHMVVVDLLRGPDRWGKVAAVLATSAAFAAYHGPQTGVQWAYFGLAGAFFGVLYLGRGFGIVAGTHAFYDVLVLVLLGGGAGA